MLDIGYANYQKRGGKLMRKLKKRYETTISSIKAQVTCPCDPNTCNGCITDMNSNRASYNNNYPMHRNNQSAWYN